MKRLKLCSQFKYSGSYISSSASFDQEILIRKQRMQSAYDQYSAQYFENRHVTLWQKLLLFNVTIIPNAIQNCVAWDYNEWHIQQLEFKQLSLLKRIMLQGNYDQFNILHAIRIAHNHHWKHLFPVSCHIHSTHIKYMAHLLKLPQSSQLYRLIRGHISIPEDNTASRGVLFRPFLNPIMRTVTYFNLNTMLEQGLRQLHIQKFPNIPYHTQIPHTRDWAITLRIPKSNELTFITKNIGKTIFMQKYRRQFITTRRERHINQGVIENTAVYEDTDSDISSIRSGISLGNVTVDSFQSDIEEELQDLSAHQLKDLLLQLNPTLTRSTRRLDRARLICQLVPLIRYNREQIHRTSRQLDAQINLQLAIIEGDIGPSILPVNSIQPDHNISNHNAVLTSTSSSTSQSASSTVDTRTQHQVKQFQRRQRYLEKQRSTEQRTCTPTDELRDLEE